MAEDDNKVTRCYAKYIFLDVVQFSKRSAEAPSRRGDTSILRKNWN